MPAGIGSQQFRRGQLVGTGGCRFVIRGSAGGWLVARGLLWYPVTDAEWQAGGERSARYHHLQPGPVAGGRARSRGQPGGGDAGDRPGGGAGGSLLLARVLPEPGVHAEPLQLHERLVSARARAPHHAPHAALRVERAQPAVHPQAARLLRVVGVARTTWCRGRATSLPIAT